MYNDLTIGPITGTMLRFVLPTVTRNLLQQFYDTADTLIIGRYLGIQALAAVGIAYALVSFLTSILLGLCMGSGIVLPLRYGEKNKGTFKLSMFVSFVPIAAVAPVLNTAVFLSIDPITYLLCVPVEIYGFMRGYPWVIFSGTSAVSLCSYFTYLLRVVGNSLIPPVFLGILTLLNVGLDLILALVSKWDVAGADAATAVSQFVSGIGICLYTHLKISEFRVDRGYMKMDRKVLAEVSGFSFLTYVQQSVMNFGILMVQGLVSSFDAVVITAFATAVKIDPFAYMPAQGFGNSFSTFIAQDYGADGHGRVEKGVKSAVIASALSCLVISLIVCVFAKELMLVLVQPQEAEILTVGVQYLRIEGTFYCGIGYLFLLYGPYRAVRRPEMSVVLTIVSLGARVVLTYILPAVPDIGVVGIWVSVPTGWFLADYTGFTYYWTKRKAIPGQGGS